MEDNDTSLILLNVDTNQKQDEDVLSAEDLAWADSCLIEDFEISETNMDSLKEALLNILDQHSEILGSFAKEPGNSNDNTVPDNLPSVMEEAVSQTAETSLDNDMENGSHDVISLLKKQPFLPNYNDEMMNVQYFYDDDDDDDDETGFVLSEFVMKPPTEDIFKVWDLDIPVEENGLDKQLQEALSSNAGPRVPKMEGSKMESLDSLVESIAGLSIK